MDIVKFIVSTLSGNNYNQSAEIYLNGIENGQVIHVSIFLEGYFKQNTNKLSEGCFAIVIKFIEDSVFLFVLKTDICGNIRTLLKLSSPWVKLPPLPGTLA